MLSSAAPLLMHPKQIQTFSKYLCIMTSAHLYLLIAGRELSLLKDHDMVADPLKQESHQFVVLPPSQLQLLQPTQQKGELGD